MRLFIALPAGGAGKTLQSTQAAMQKKGVRGKYAPPENLHVTLAFLGETPDPAPVIAAMTRVPLPRTELRFDRMTLFGDVLVALIRPDGALEEYARALRRSLDEAGIRYDKKAFRPHVTLARKTAFPSPEFRLFPFERGLKNTRFAVRSAVLFASDTSGETSRYTALFTQKAETINDL